MKQILVISGHPDLHQSHANKIIIQDLKQSSFHPHIHDLSILYKDLNVHVEQDQKLLLDADIIVLQFPFYWYSVPGILKNWLDNILTYNFAYGSHGDKLKNKDFILSFTIGGRQDSYSPLGSNHFPIPELIKPLQQLAYLCQMTYHDPVYTNGMVYMPDVKGFDNLDIIHQKAHDHAKRVLQKFKQLSDS